MYQEIYVTGQWLTSSSNINKAPAPSSPGRGPGIDRRTLAPR